MFTIRKFAAPKALRQAKPRRASAEVVALVLRLRTRAADGDVELAKLLDELAPYLTAEAEPSVN